MALEPEVAMRANTLFYIRAGALPFFFFARACLGLLAGFQRIWLLAGLSVFCAALDVAGNYLALNVLHWGLDGTGWATGFAQTVSAVLGIVFVVSFPPTEAEGRLRWCGSSRHDKARNEAQGLLVGEGGGAATGGSNVVNEPPSLVAHPWAAIKEYLRASGNIVIRSVLLQTATYGLAVAAGQLGTAALAAHQVGL